MANASLLQVENLLVRLRGRDLVRGVTFDIRAGDFLAIIGPNGAGKTVLVKALLDQLPYTGSVSWNGKPRVGYVPQQIDLDRYLNITLEDFLQLKISILNLEKKAITEAIELVGLSSDALTLPLRVLSGGQMQRGLIAFALIGNPDIIFFDEPTASIDAPGEEQVYGLLHRLQDTRGMAIVLVSHELELVTKYASHILCLNKDLVYFGEPAAALAPEVTERLYGSNHAHVHALTNHNHR